MRKIFVIIVIITNFCVIFPADRKATIREEKMRLFTYMFSEPDPVPKIGSLYPYFRFEGYTNRGEFKEWNMVVLENDYIKVYVCPDIGGKIWGAIEKSTGKEFLYFNNTVKFRDIGMRGAWTSGGMEYNFGDIGHIPTCATPVDYSLDKRPDGSVSCSVGAIDLPSGTKWNVNIILHADKAYFQTVSSWFNKTSLPVTYYHWMNAAAKADGDLEFVYPGNKWIGHRGEYGNWPFLNDIDVSFYKNNNFGIYKSYHVLNSYSNFMGGYWHDDDFGFGHIADYDEKPGKKIWIWGLSDQGMIWESLLTDTDGQYVEFQSGKLFNQASAESTFSPFKHREFLSYDSDIMRESWFPLKGTKGMDAASEYAVLKKLRIGNRVELLISALQNINADLKVISDGEMIVYEKLRLFPLKLYKRSFKLEKGKDFSVEIGDNLLNYSSAKENLVVDRPVKPYLDINWGSAYGLYVKALELEKQRKYSEAKEIYFKSIEKESTFLPSLNRIALGYLRSMNYKAALKFSIRSLSIDTYDPLGNYIFGLANSKLNKSSYAKNGFSIASQSIKFRSASYTELAKIFIKEGDLGSALKYAEKALVFNAANINALEILAVIHRKQSDKREAGKILERIYGLDQTNHFVDFERLLRESVEPLFFKNKISNELPSESFLDLAIFYYDLGCTKEAIRVLSMAPEHPIVYLWHSYLDEKNRKKFLDKSLSLSPYLIFPHREESAKIIEYFIKMNGHWKLKYYLGLIYWNKGLKVRARELFNKCGEDPDFPPFYLAKMKLFKNDMKIKDRAIKRAVELDSSALTVILARIKHSVEKGNFEKAEKYAEKSIKDFPEKSELGLLYAKILMGLKKYDECSKFLEKYTVLPYEGATEGRKIYHEACIRASFEGLKKNDYLNAIAFAKKAKLWPVNLGVGKSYDVDERLSNFIIALGYEKYDNRDMANKYYLKVMDHSTPPYRNEDPDLYIQAIVLKKFGKKNIAVKMIESAIRKNPENLYFKWIKDSIVNDKEYKLKTEGVSENKKLNLLRSLFMILSKINK